jgi:hypothetical protein
MIMTIGSSFIIFVEKVLFWGETTFLDSALYFFRALFVGECNHLVSSVAPVV